MGARPVHPNTPKQREGETDRIPWQILLSSKNFVEEGHPRFVDFCGPVARCRVLGSAKQKWRPLASDFGLERVVATVSVVCGYQ